MIALRSAAKLNLTLEILGTRADGYHELCSVVQTVGLWDELAIHLIEGPSRLTCNWAALESPDNLCLRAAEHLAAAVGVRFSVHLELCKRIPTGAGLGGGSGNAAATLVGLNELLDLKLSRDTLARLAAGLGADVPFFLQGGMALMEGVGDRLTPLEAPPGWHFVIAKGARSVNTAWAYQQYDRSAKPGQAVTRSRPFLAALRAGQVDKAAALFKNVMELPVAAACPEVTALKHRLLEQGALGAAMSGSGSAVYGAFASQGQARLAWSDVSRIAEVAFLAAPTPQGVEVVGRETAA